MLSSPLRTVLSQVMSGVVGAPAGAPWTERALWPQGASSPGLWIDPAYTPSEFQDSAGTTPISTVGTVLDSSNPVGLMLDRKGGLVLGPEINPSGSTWSAGYTLNGALQIPTGWTPYTPGNVSSMTVTPGLLAFSATAHLGGIHIGSNKKSVELYVRARKTAQVSGSPSLEAMSHVDSTGTPSWLSIVPVGATIGQWYEKTIKFTDIASNAVCYLSNFNGAASWEISHCSIREIPGLHLLQSTSAARPVASARVNLLTYSEDFSNAAWATPSALVSKTASSITELVVSNEHYTNQILTKAASAIPVVFSIKFKNGTGSRNFAIGFTDGTSGGWCSIFSTAGSVVASSQAIGLTTGWTFTAASISAADADGFYTASISLTTNTSTRLDAVLYLVDGTTRFYTGDGTSTIQVKQAQVNLGPTALPYQRVGAASDYTATGFPVYLKLDGTDDGLASATFSAGTLTSSMDCLIALRRDSAERFILFYQAVGVGSFYFGLVDAAGGSSPCFNASGSPTVWVDGTQVSSGRASDLSTALTLGSWHILEFRGMDLSAWTRLQSGFWASGYGFNGAIGKPYLFANGQDANRTKARARMAAYFGVALP